MKRIAFAAVIALTGIALFTPWLFGEVRGTQTASRLEAPYPLQFPENFAWGVAVAAQHVEHQQPSDWTARAISRDKQSPDIFAISISTLQRCAGKKSTSTLAMQMTSNSWLLSDSTVIASVSHGRASSLAQT